MTRIPAKAGTHDPELFPTGSHETDPTLAPITPGPEAAATAGEGGGEEADDGPKHEKPAWLISVAVHAIVGLVFTWVVFAAHSADQELPPMVVTTMDPPPKIEKPKEKRDVEAKVEINTTEVADTPSPITNLDVKLEEITQTEDASDAATPKGREEAVADSEMGSSGAFAAIGAGGGAAGKFGFRNGGGKRRALSAGGGSAGSESAVDSALRWFKRHQSASGEWEATTFQNNCTDGGVKCEPGANHRNGKNEDVGLTGLALLCYLGAGYDHHTPSKYKATVQKAVDFLLSVQTADGVFMANSFNYEHAMATMALAEALAMTNDPRLKGPAQKGVDVILARRAPVGKFTGGIPGAWGDFQQTASKCHTSASSWNVQALKSALAAGLDVKDGMKSGKNWLQGLWRATLKLRNIDEKGLDPYKDITPLAYYYDGDTGEASELGGDGTDLHALSCIGALCGVFLGMHAGDPLTETQANYLMKYNMPTTWPCNAYYLYYGTFASFQLGGERWKRWNGTTRDMLVNAQRTGATASCFDGSWDYDGNRHYGKEVGRLLSTALCCLSLEVYYRYAQVGNKPVQEEPAKPLKKAP